MVVSPGEDPLKVMRRLLDEAHYAKDSVVDDAAKLAVCSIAIDLRRIAEQLESRRDG